ncbi:hypothetical protein LMG24238_00112 [Paraburkholderia sediminicola]|uniref:Uncharacterized protein n=1 Tax=Paraburkholderia sediminicola TaxID=458836 RepID=A0A6J4ZPD7_9BURK|nr:hypothetical protein LMG24238_00112 [Paraburkholderia sediminicola]
MESHFVGETSQIASEVSRRVERPKLAELSRTVTG